MDGQVGWRRRTQVDTVATLKRDPDSAHFDAFISYSHVDQVVALAVQRSLQRIGRRRGQVRALRIFRDGTDMNASPNLWKDVELAIQRSLYMVAILSPAAAASQWVNKEIGAWLSMYGADRILLGVAGGDVAYDWNRRAVTPESTAAPPVLKAPNSLPQEPLFVDLRDLHMQNSRSPLIRERMVTIAAPIHGRDKRDLFDHEVREWKRNRRLRIGVISALVFLLAFSGVSAVIALNQRRAADTQRAIAVHQRNAAVAAALASASQVQATSNPALSLDLAMESYHTNPSLGSQSALIQARFNFDSAPAQPLGTANQDAFLEEGRIAVSPDGSTYAIAGGAPETLSYFATSTRTLLWRRSIPGGWVDALSYSADGRQLIVACEQGDVQVFSSSGSMTSVPGLAEYGVTSYATFDPIHGNLIIIQGHRLEIRSNHRHFPVLQSVHSRWKLSDPEMAPNGRHLAVFTDRPGHEGRVWSLSPEGRLIQASTFSAKWPTSAPTFIRNNLLAFTDTTGLRTIDVDGTYIHPANATPIADGVARSVAPVAQGTMIAIGGDSGTVELVDTQNLSARATMNANSKQGILALSSSASGNILTALGSNGTTSVWDTSPARKLGPAPFGRGAYSTVFAFLARNRMAVLGNGLHLWTHVLSDPARSKRPVGAIKQLNDVAADPSGTVFAAVSEGGRTHRSLEVVGAGRIRYLAPADTPNTRPALSNGGAVIAIGGYNGSVSFWRQGSRRPTVEHFSGRPSDVALTTDGSRLAVVAPDGVLNEWRVDTGKAIVSKPLGLGGLYAVEYSPDGKEMLVATGGGAVVLVNSGSGRIARRFRGHVGMVDRVAFSADGRILASAGADHTVRIWSARTGRPMAVQGVPGPYGGFDGLQFSKDGMSLAWSNERGITVWPALLALTRHDCSVIRPWVSALDVSPYLPSRWQPFCRLR